jgi:hypothetical protein
MEDSHARTLQVIGLTLPMQQISIDLMFLCIGVSPSGGQSLWLSSTMPPNLASCAAYGYSGAPLAGEGMREFEPGPRNICGLLLAGGFQAQNAWGS